MLKFWSYFMPCLEKDQDEYLYGRAAARLARHLDVDVGTLYEVPEADFPSGVGRVKEWCWIRFGKQVRNNQGEVIDYVPDEEAWVEVTLEESPLQEPEDPCDEEFLEEIEDQCDAE